MRDRHAYGTDGKDRFPPDAIDVQHGRDGSEEHYDADNARGKE